MTGNPKICQKQCSPHEVFAWMSRVCFCCMFTYLANGQPALNFWGLHIYSRENKPFKGLYFRVHWLSKFRKKQLFSSSLQKSRGIQAASSIQEVKPGKLRKLLERNKTSNLDLG